MIQKVLFDWNTLVMLTALRLNAYSGTTWAALAPPTTLPHPQLRSHLHPITLLGQLGLFREKL